MILRALQTQWAPFVERLCSRTDVETAGIILAERLRDGVLLARHFAHIPDDGYQIRHVDRLRIEPIAINRLTRRARDEGLSVLTVHTHPGTSEPWFSYADDEGDSRLMPSFWAQMPGPHGSLVIAAETAATSGRVWTEAGSVEPLRVRVIGRAIQNHPLSARRGSSECFERQLLALGEAGQAVLNGLHVGIIGAGGTGSVAFAQLCHLGVGHVSLVDGDRIEASNLSRIIGASREDIGRTPKVDIALRYAQRLGLGTRVDVIHGNLGHEVDPTALENCDALLSCVDKHTPRALLNRLSYSAAIPLIDMGSAFRVDVNGRITAGVGRVVVVGPGRRCLACWGHIDANRLRIEALSTADRASEEAEGYIAGADVPQPSVIAFNTMIAGAAVIELLRMTTGFSGAEDSPARLAFDFITGVVTRNSLALDSYCSICCGSL